MKLANLKPKDLTRCEQGFSLLEQLVIIIIVGILAATAAPGFLAWKANYDVRRATDEAAQTFLFFQRESIRLNPVNDDTVCPSSLTPSPKGCCFRISNTAVNGNTPGLSSSNCPLGNLAFSNGVIIDSAATLGPSEKNQSVKFSAIGSIVLSDTGTLVLTKAQATRKGCMVISKPLGLIRTGIWDGTACT